MHTPSYRSAQGCEIDYALSGHGHPAYVDVSGRLRGSTARYPGATAHYSASPRPPPQSWDEGRSYFTYIGPSTPLPGTPSLHPQYYVSTPAQARGPYYTPSPLGHYPHPGPVLEGRPPRRSRLSNEVLDSPADEPFLLTPVQGIWVANPRVYGEFPSPSTPGLRENGEPCCPCVTQTYQKPHGHPPYYYVSPPLSSTTSRSLEEQNARSHIPPSSPRNKEVLSPTPQYPSTGRSPLSPSLQQRLSDILDRPPSAPPSIEHAVEEPTVPAPDTSAPLNPEAELGLNFPPPDAVIDTPKPSFTAATSSPQHELSSQGIESGEANLECPESTRSPPTANSPEPHAKRDPEPASPLPPTPTADSTDTRESKSLVRDELGRLDPNGRHEPPNLPKGYLEIESTPDTNCQFTLPVPSYLRENGVSLAGLLQCTIQGRAKIRLVV